MTTPLHGNDDEREMSDFGVFRALPWLIGGYVFLFALAVAIVLAAALLQGDSEPFEVLANLMRTLE